eukprot:CAMPEP_0179159056 /NCGR_PEP_ID=MMETSP0796-20121207/77643_1 /TAXON_ID=73915 /ORGANISM="Pyrodinium bahamense, Strain pbaha01" /LENGTH=37 /DNA_ID= /DNA_START= /DNA_END= /DNA_ORIENTATION=
MGGVWARRKQSTVSRATSRIPSGEARMQSHLSTRARA